jgi:putative flippase GtrA
MRQFTLFCVSGGLAFLVDAGLTQAWVSWAGLDPWSARALAFPVAVTCTWLFNRSITFRAHTALPLHREWALYVGSQLVGMAVNLGSYALLVASSAWVARWPAVGVAVGSVAGLFANFLGAKHVVFSKRHR